MTLRFLYLFLSLLLLASCGDSRREDITRLVKLWQGREIKYPDGVVFTKLARDTVPVDVYARSHKVLVYVDSAGCTSCRLQLHEWKKFIAEVDSVTEGTTRFLFFLTPKSVKEARNITRRDDFTHPICVDMQNRLDSLNHFPDEEMFHTFLLDENNRVKVVGNPIHNRAVRGLYLKHLTGREVQDAVKTIIDVPVRQFTLDTLCIGESKTASFTLRNVGGKSLVIHDVVTSCGCTDARYEKHPILPGDSTVVHIVYTAEDPGYFSKSAQVYVNAEPSSVRLLINGVVRDR